MVRDFQRDSKSERSQESSKERKVTRHISRKRTVFREMKDSKVGRGAAKGEAPQIESGGEEE